MHETKPTKFAVWVQQQAHMGTEGILLHLIAILNQLVEWLLAQYPAGLVMSRNARLRRVSERAEP